MLNCPICAQIVRCPKVALGLKFTAGSGFVTIAAGADAAITGAMVVDDDTGTCLASSTRTFGNVPVGSGSGDDAMGSADETALLVVENVFALAFSGAGGGGRTKGSACSTGRAAVVADEGG